MFKILENKNFYSKFICFIIVFMICTLSYTPSYANEEKARNNDIETKPGGLAPVFDGIIGIISDLIFGKRLQAQVDSGEDPLNFANRNWKDGMVYRVYNNIAGDIKFKSVFYLCIIFYIAYLGVQFSIGVAAISAKELVSRYLKIAIIIFFISPSGWEIYLEFIVKNILETARWLNRAITASMYNVPISEIKGPFEPINMIIDTVTSGEIWNKIWSLFWANGFLFAIMILVVFLYVLMMSIIVLTKVLLTYASLLILASILLSVGPIFILCSLFEKTKTYFHSWVKNLIGIFFEQYLLFLGFFLFCLILTLMIRGLFGFDTYVGPVIELKFMIKMPEFLKNILDTFFNAVSWLGIKKPPIGEYIINLRHTVLEAPKPVQIATDLPANIFSAGGIFIVAMMFNKFCDAVSSVTQKITGSDAGSSSMSSAQLNQALNKAASAVTTGAAKNAAKVGTGYALFAAPNYLKNKSQELAKSIQLRENNADKQGKFSQMITKAMKIQQKALSGSSKIIGSNLTSKLYQTTQDKMDTNQIEDIQMSRQTMLNKELETLVGKNKKYSSVNDIGETERQNILANIDSQISEKIANAKIQALSAKGKVSPALAASIKKQATETVADSHDATIRHYGLPNAVGKITGNTATSVGKGIKTTFTDGIKEGLKTTEEGIKSIKGNITNVTTKPKFNDTNTKTRNITRDIISKLKKDLR